MTDLIEPVKTPLKRRGRKPKGGKLIETKEIKQDDTPDKKQSIIVHLKCFTAELKQHDIFKYDPKIECVEPFTYDKYQICDTISVEDNIENKEIKNENINNSISEYENKLKMLNIILDNLDANTIKSSCFWCTYPFDTKPFFIPKNISENNILAYGCFCSPECSLAYLLNEHLDESIKIERIYLLNSVYCPICSYTENIKPAVSPYYTLNKYFGNMSIEEYRKLSNTKTNPRYTTVDKPITLSNPEFCEDHL